MKRISFLFVFIMLVSLVSNVGNVNANNEHRVLLFGDSLTATNMSNWTYEITHDYKLVAKGGQDTRWVLSQIRQLVQSGEINSYDTAVVWIGVNNPELAVSDIPQIYAILHSYGIKIVGVTQYLPTYGNPSEETINNIHTFNDIVRTEADIVVDFAVDPVFVDENGYVRDEISLDGIHLIPRLMAEPIASVINRAIDELYLPTPTATATVTATPTQTVTPTPTATATITSTAVPLIPTPEIINAKRISINQSAGIMVAIVLLIVLAVWIILRLRK